MERSIEYLQLLAKSFPSIAAASTEIINLEAILNLPKGTEHLVTDIHGEYDDAKVTQRGRFVLRHLLR